MRRPLFATFACLLPLVSAACSEEPSAAPTPPPPVAAVDFMAEYTDTLCERSSQCSALASYIEAGCDDEVRGLFGEDVEAAIQAGRIVYDADAAGACVEGLAKTDCLAEQPSDATLAACLSALSGTIAPGQPCFGTFECAQGICPSVTGDACPAVCPVVAKAGEACSLLGGSDCDVRAGLRCSGGTCVAPKEQGAACEDNFGCESGLVCVTNVCVPLRGDHQGCSQDASCQPGFFCAAGGDEGGVCEARLSAGMACGGAEAEDANAAFRHVQCEDGLVCLLAGLDENGTSVSGTCGDAHDLGGDCTVEPSGWQVFETGCKSGLVCNEGKCEMPPSTGAACGPHFSCAAEEAFCDPMTTVCTALKPNGAPCTIDPECEGGYCGGAGTCVDLATFCAP